MNTRFLTLAMLLGCAVASLAKDKVLHTFKKTQLSDKFWCEGATFGDLNRDGKLDLISGPFWYEGPTFEERHEYYPAKTTFKLKKGDGSEPGGIRWGAATAAERGPLIASVANPGARNVIGTHSGAYSVYRALAVASGAR